MKSKLFNRFDPKDVGDNRFAEDLAMLLSLTPEQWNSIVSALTPLLECRTSAERRPIVEKLEAATGLARTVLQRITNQAGFFLSALHHEDTRDEDSRSWACDLTEMELLTSDATERFALFIDCLRDQALSQIEAIQRKREAEAGVLPAFTGASTTVELRGVFKKDYKWGKDLDAFIPEIADVVPVVSVAISVDSGATKRFTFQATPAELEYLIKELQAAKKCAATLKDRCSEVQ
jgi:hypothetical protein